MLGIYFFMGKLSRAGSALPQAVGRVANSTENIQPRHAWSRLGSPHFRW